LYTACAVNLRQVGVGDSPSCLGSSRPSVSRGVAHHRRSSEARTVDRGLEEHGRIERTVYPAVPPRVADRLTPLGESINRPLRQLCEWTFEHPKALERAGHAPEIDQRFRDVETACKTPARLSEALTGESERLPATAATEELEFLVRDFQGSADGEVGNVKGMRCSCTIAPVWI